MAAGKCRDGGDRIELLATINNYIRQNAMPLKLNDGRHLGRLWLAFSLMLHLGLNAAIAATTTFSFALDEPCKTSAGVYLPDGTLVRTLWSKVRYYAAGVYSSNWDGLDDNGNTVAPGAYEIRLLEHNTEYVWDGAIGNTSANMFGPAVHSAFQTMHDMSISGTNAFYATGYNEGKYDFASFSTSDPQTVLAKWSDNVWTSDIYDRNWSFVCSDSNWVYFAAPISMNPTNSVTCNYRGFVIATQIGANPQTNTFTAGVAITNNNYYYLNGVYVGAQPGLSGISVELNSNLLAVSVAPDNEVYLLDKRSGAQLGGFQVTNPGKLSFAPDGSLWVISGTNIAHFTGLTSTPAEVLTIPGFCEPLAIAVCPTNANLILVADGGASQQIKAFDSSGNALWTYGLTGGYQANGPQVTTNKFWFLCDLESADGTFLCFAPDASFWVGDGGNHRALHFSSSLSYLEQIMFQPHSYRTCVDQNNTSRVFNQFLEFNVDYSKPLSQGWTLVNNWKANVDTNHLDWEEGLFEVTTFTNNRTYGLIHNNLANTSELVELTTNGIRFTGIFPMASPVSRWVSLGPDGSARAVTMGAALWYQSSLAGFDTNGNPMWNPETLLASAPNASSDPVPRCCSFGNVRTTISSNNILISFDQSLNNGWHLGGIRLGGTNWLWKASPAGNLNGLGTYEISNGVSYGGNTLQAMDRNIIYGYHGEFFRSQGQAGQHMHFYDDGLFVGQFGETSIGHSAYEGAVQGFAGNAHSPSLVKASTGDYYVWDNDESAHGPQRWQLVNAKNIREQTGAVTNGGNVSLTPEGNNFPTGLVAAIGSQSCDLSWQNVPGATSYSIYYSTNNGGPYSALAGTVTNTIFKVAGLCNGLTYYFVVSATIADVEGPTSEQIPVFPFDTSQTVLRAGCASEGQQGESLIDVVTGAGTFGQPCFIGTEYPMGVLNLRERDYYGYGNLANETVGNQGFVIYNWGGTGTNVMHLAASFGITNISGWTGIPYLQRAYKVDNLIEPDFTPGALGGGSSTGLVDGISGNPRGSIGISASDTNFHYLTVVSPAEFADTRSFTMTLSSTNGLSASYPVNEKFGYSHVFQFIFKGNVTLTADCTGGAGAIVQSLFLDDAPVVGSLAAPSQLRVGF
jgi:hypothetical protein